MLPFSREAALSATDAIGMALVGSQVAQNPVDGVGRDQVEEQDEHDQHQVEESLKILQM